MCLALAPGAGRLEGDIAVLEQHLETMRATYQLNAEKLDYNYRVLLERDAGG
jgi:dynein regulatory complex protein 1